MSSPRLPGRSLARVIVLVALAAPGGLVGFAGAASAQEGEGLTVDQAVEQALDRKGFREAQRAEVRGARGEQSAAGAWPNPSFSFDREQVWDGAGTAEDFFVLEQPLPVWGTRRLREEAAEKEREAIEAGNEAERLERRIEARRAFYAALRANERLAIAQEWRERVGRAVEAMERRLEGDEVSELAVERMRHTLDNARAAVDSARAAVVERAGELAAMVGRPEGAERWEPQGDLAPEAIPERDALTGDLDRRPEIRALDARQAGASKSREAASRLVFPTPIVRGGYKRLDAPTGGSMHGLIAGLSISLPIFNQFAGAKRTARARSIEIDARRRLIASRTTERIAALHHAASTRLEAAERYREEAVPRAENLLERTRERREADEAAAADVVEAYRSWLDTREQALDRAWEARRAELDLRRVAGGFR